MIGRNDQKQHGGGDTGEHLDVITQRKIAEYQALQPAARRWKQLRQRLVDALEAGAPVEPGPRCLTLEIRVQRALRVAYLIEALRLPEELVAQLRAAAPERSLRYLRVR
jgi:hypothetical protein